jgi:uncharacterized protein (TIGR02001 family)
MTKLTKLLKGFEFSLLFLFFIPTVATANTVKYPVDVEDNLKIQENLKIDSDILNSEQKLKKDLDIKKFAEFANHDFGLAKTAEFGEPNIVHTQKELSQLDAATKPNENSAHPENVSASKQVMVYTEAEFPDLDSDVITKASGLLSPPKHQSVVDTKAKDTELIAQEGETEAAEDPGIPGSISATATLLTNYKLRGISQTDNSPAIQASFDYALGLNENLGLYLGIFGSNVDFNDGDEANLELDFYGGFTYQVTEALSVNVGGYYYTYPGADSSLNYNYFEALFRIDYNLEVAALAALVYYSPDFFVSSGDSLYVQGTVDVPLPENFSIRASVGHQSISENSTFGAPDYFDWSLGVGYSIAGINLLLQYVDTNLSSSECFGGLDLCEARVVFSMSRTF